MKRLWSLTLIWLAAAVSAPAFAGEPCSCCAPACSCCAPACSCCAPEGCDSCAERWYFRIERNEHACIVEAPTTKWYATPSKVVCEKKDCNCKDRITCTEIIPICKEGCKKEVQVKVCTTVYMHCGPVMDMKTVVVPPAPPMPPVEK